MSSAPRSLVYLNVGSGLIRIAGAVIGHLDTSSSETEKYPPCFLNEQNIPVILPSFKISKRETLRYRGRNATRHGMISNVFNITKTDVAKIIQKYSNVKNTSGLDVYPWSLRKLEQKR